ncbi:MAG TPA: transcription antitermination factor NusB [Candidatus Kapabacteria bacterium]|nr:transcription antitermination factor NusB [Candidatus Kapabacteria bacterium]
MSENAHKAKTDAEKETISSRRYARERVMQTLYAVEMTHGDFPFLRRQIIDSDAKLDETNKQFAVDLAVRAHDSEEECNEILKKRSEHWDISRMAAIDRAILHMAIAELKYFSDVPPKVTIDEAIEIAKRFSTAESGKFINGILNAVLADLKQEHSIRKRGRGLREE